MTSALAIGLGACLVWVVILAVSDQDPSRGPWPPVQGSWLSAAWAWGLTVLIYVGIVRAASADLNGLDLPGWVRWGLGIALSVAGSGLQTWGAARLGFWGTSGWDAGLATGGPYAVSRHPQYLGQAVGMIGIALIGGSLGALTVAAAGVATLIYAAFVEDRAIAARHEGFSAYAARVPFLIPRPSR